MSDEPMTPEELAAIDARLAGARRVDPRAMYACVAERFDHSVARLHAGAHEDVRRLRAEVTRLSAALDAREATGRSEPELLPYAEVKNG